MDFVRKKIICVVRKEIEESFRAEKENVPE